jgi:hypothetical protein
MNAFFKFFILKLLFKVRKNKNMCNKQNKKRLSYKKVIFSLFNRGNLVISELN